MISPEAKNAKIQRNNLLTYFNKTSSSSKSVQESDEVTVDFQNSHIAKPTVQDYSKYDNDTNNLHSDLNKNMKKKQNYQLNNKLKQTNLMDGKNWILKEDMVTDEIPDSSIANPMFEKNENENKNGSDYENKNEKKKESINEKIENEEMKNKEAIQEGNLN